MHRLSFLLLLLVLTSFNVNAACDTETIQFYLDKGFTQEQITKLCSTPETNNNSGYQPYQKPVVIYQTSEENKDGISAEEIRAIKQFKGGIDARSVDVTDDRINFIRRICVIAGNTPDVDQRVKRCIDVAISIARDGMIVKESGKGLLFFGGEQIEIISSDIERKFLVADPWAGVSPDVRFQLENKYNHTEKGNKTIIPLRKSASVGSMVTSIRTIASQTQLRKTGSNESEVAKVLDDNYVPPTEEEYIANNPTYEEIKEEKKKKKKWWNPFD